MRIRVLALSAIALSACSTGGASGGNRPYPAAQQKSAPAAPAPRSSAPRSTAGGGFDAQDVPLATALAGGRAEGKPVALYLFSKTCGWCRRLESEILPDPTVSAEMASFYNVRITMESAAGREVTTRYNVHAFPTVVFPDASGGRRTKDIEGYSAPVNFSSRLRKAH